MSFKVLSGIGAGSLLMVRFLRVTSKRKAKKLQESLSFDTCKSLSSWLLNEDRTNPLKQMPMVIIQECAGPHSVKMVSWITEVVISSAPSSGSKARCHAKVPVSDFSFSAARRTKS